MEWGYIEDHKYVLSTEQIISIIKLNIYKNMIKIPWKGITYE